MVTAWIRPEERMGDGEAMAELKRLGTMITPVTATEGMGLRAGDATSGSGSTASSP